ncbi:MOSC domain-containing protein [Rhodobacter sp. NTK016B]|uniref:MOSC domain-containing protein n=1 Tax=Rhodobacter sp. NTK016B TaxID=2759676 RepID=UPI001A8EB35F|nr:MOSC domain-containing protein [Rhodobacter sp. NTK016B]
MSTPRLAHIVRHPVKSLGWQTLERAVLSQGRPLPFDRIFAVATEAAKFDGAPEGWQSKLNFMRGAAEGSLMAIRAEFDETRSHLVLTHPDLPAFEGTLPDDGAALIAWLSPLWPANRPAPRGLVARQDGGDLTDRPGGRVSLMNLASLKALGDRMGMDLSIHRFRGNLWLEGLAPWQEFDLVGHELRIGQTRLRVDAPITRCVATTFDPLTGAQDGDTLAALEFGWNHRDLGALARVIDGGEIAIGDPVEILT